MKPDRYPFSADENHLTYEFESDGPNGKIAKMITFRPQNANGTTYFSLAFGDPDDDGRSLNYNSVSNNQDRNKILATVAAAVVQFSRRFPDMAIFAEGSTRVRTRLYQMSISMNLAAIERIFEVYGSHNNRWERFRKSRNYDAFLIRRK